MDASGGGVVKTEPITAGSWVVVSGRLGRVVRATRLGNADGYDVATATETYEGHLPHFAPDWCVRSAVVGVNVCAHPRGEHWCGLLHVPHPEWLTAGAS